MATFIPPWATATPPYAYDAGPTRCFLHDYEAIYHYDDTGCNRSITSSTSVTTLLSGASESDANEACFPDPAGGREHDPADYGMSLYGYRYYNPDLGRWVNRDPIEELSFAHMNMRIVQGNLIYDRHAGELIRKHESYSFVRNNAVNIMEYLGLFPCTAPAPTGVPGCADDDWVPRIVMSSDGVATLNVTWSCHKHSTCVDGYLFLGLTYGAVSGRINAHIKKSKGGNVKQILR